MPWCWPPAKRPTRPGCGPFASGSTARRSRSWSSRPLATCPNWRGTAGSLRRRVVDGIMELLGEVMRDDCLIWAHNLGSGPQSLPRARTHLHLPLLLASRSSRTITTGGSRTAGITSRPCASRAFARSDAVASAVLAASPRICHVAINQADATVLEKHFPGLAGWLPNPVERRRHRPPRGWKPPARWLREQLGEDAPVWLLPCRLLRRKNIAEALLLTRWLRPEAWLVTTGGVSSAEEQAYADTLAAAAQTHGWRLRLGILQGDESQKPSVPGIAGRQRSGPAHVAPGRLRPALPRSGGGPASARGATVAQHRAGPGEVRFQSSRSLIGKSGWIRRCSTGAREREAPAAPVRGVEEPDAPRRRASSLGKPAVLAAGKAPCPVPFSRLTLTAQLEVLAQPVERLVGALRSRSIRF